MSHFDAEASAEAFATGLAESCATRARGIETTHAKARNRLTDFKTQEIIRFSSAINFELLTSHDSHGKLNHLIVDELTARHARTSHGDSDTPIGGTIGYTTPGPRSMRGEGRNDQLDNL
jgi:hypothetical protein